MRTVGARSKKVGSGLCKNGLGSFDGQVWLDSQTAVRLKADVTGVWQKGTKEEIVQFTMERTDLGTTGGSGDARWRHRTANLDCLKRCHLFPTPQKRTTRHLKASSNRCTMQSVNQWDNHDSEEAIIEAHEFAQLSVRAASEMKAEELVVLDVRDLVSYCDYFVVATAPMRDKCVPSHSVCWTL